MMGGGTGTANSESKWIRTANRKVKCVLGWMSKLGEGERQQTTVKVNETNWKIVHENFQQ